MAKEKPNSTAITVNYDAETDILTLIFTDTPQIGLAEEADDEIWVRYNPQTCHLLTMDVHHLSKRLQSTFGPDLIYEERTDLSSLEQLLGLH
jgi:uncharacterized protein YuzE